MDIGRLSKVQTVATRIVRKLGTFDQDAAIDAAIKLERAPGDPLENRAALAAIGFQEYGSNNRKFRFK